MELSLLVGWALVYMIELVAETMKGQQVQELVLVPASSEKKEQEQALAGTMMALLVMGFVLEFHNWEQTVLTLVWVETTKVLPEKKQVWVLASWAWKERFLFAD